MSQIRYFIKLVIMLVSVSMITGCGSSKKFERDAIYDAGKRVEKKVKKSRKKKSGVGNSQSVDLSRVKDASAQAVVKEASFWLGAPYVYGGHSKRGTDCSGMVMEVYLKATGIKLPRSAREQKDFCKRIDKKQLSAGDLIFFANGKGPVNHVGIYIGDKKMIHASSSKGVMVSGIDEDYFARRYHSSGRVPGMKFKNPGDIRQENKPVPEVKKGRVTEIRVDQLDELLNQKLDSIYGK